MAFGLQVKNPNGQIILRITDRLTRIIGVFSTGTSNGSFTVDPAYGGTDAFFAVNPADRGVSGPNSSPPDITMSGRTITWSWGPNSEPTSRVPLTVNYGIF